MVITKNSLVLGAIGLLVLGAAAVMPGTASAQSCTFARTLYVGSSGSDVFCLQNWLAAQGYFNVAATGYYGPVTQQAVIRWQLAQGQAATGVFSPGSIRQLPPLSGTYTGNASGALNAIQDAVNVHRDARDEVDRARSGRDKDRAEAYLRDSQMDLIASLQAFIAGDYNRAIDRARDAEEAAEDALDEIGSNRGSNNSGSNADRRDAQDAINDANDELSDARRQVNRASSGSNKNQAIRLLDEAEDLIEDAEDAFDDRDYRRAVRFADQAMDRIDDALDRIDRGGSGGSTSGSEANAWRALNDAEDALEDAWDEVDYARNGSARNRAINLLEKAQDVLDDAWDAYEDRDYRDAIDFAKRAEDLIEDALDEL